MAPTLEGPWRTNISLSLWAPTNVTFKSDNGESKETIHKNLSWLLDVIDYEVPLEAEFRKGSFGVYAHLLGFKINDTIESGHLKLKYDPECRRARDTFWDIQVAKMTALGDSL